MINNLQRAMVLERLTIEAKHSMAGFPQVCFVRNTVRNPNIIVGEYAYYDDPENAEDFERNVLYHFPFIGDRLVIGKFCAIARLEVIAWWDWPIEKVTAHLDRITGADVDAPEAATAAD